MPFDIAADNAGHREDLWSSSHKGLDGDRQQRVSKLRPREADQSESDQIFQTEPCLEVAWSCPWLPLERMPPSFLLEYRR